MVSAHSDNTCKRTISQPFLAYILKEKKSAIFTVIRLWKRNSLWIPPRGCSHGWPSGRTSFLNLDCSRSQRPWERIDIKYCWCRAPLSLVQILIGCLHKKLDDMEQKNLEIEFRCFEIWLSQKWRKNNKDWREHSRLLGSHKRTNKLSWNNSRKLLVSALFVYRNMGDKNIKLHLGGGGTHFQS